MGTQTCLVLVFFTILHYLAGYLSMIVKTHVLFWASSNHVFYVFVLVLIWSN